MFRSGTRSAKVLLSGEGDATTAKITFRGRLVEACLGNRFQLCTVASLR